MLLLKELQQDIVSINQITLKPLSFEHITHLLSETLKASAIAPLAELIMRKTDGNPFFVNEFLKTLHQDGVLWFDFNQNAWQWNLNDIEELNITDNVVELLLSQLRKLPEATQHVVQFAACIGNRFDLKTLSIVSQASLSEVTAQALTVAIRQGLIVPT